MGDLTKHFSRREFVCRCGCGLMNVKGRLLLMLEVIREAADQAVHVGSGCRCRKRNSHVNGAANSAHLTGEAADIWVKGMGNRELGDLIKRLYEEGLLPFLRYCYLITGATGTSVHIGVDERPRSRVFAF